MINIFPHRAPRGPRSRHSRPSPRLERLEQRNLLAMVPYGAAPQDTAEFMLGDVLVSVVFMESNGEVDSSSEDWTAAEIQAVKERVVSGVQWWEELLAAQASVHDLNFHFDFTYADQPVETVYEPISRRSDDFPLWLDEFFVAAGVGLEGSFSQRIRQFNHDQRLAHETHWAFTIFVVNADQDADGRFDSTGSFSQSFAYAGGRFFITTSERPASSIAHEVAHMFWAMDEYRGGKTYFDRRGYYNTQNLNAIDGHPDPAKRVHSIMDAAEAGYVLDAVSPSALEMIGWKDSDQDGIFDVLDVPHLLVGQTEFDPLTRRLRLDGHVQVQTLPNLNPSGMGHDITLNEIDRIEVRFDESAWQTVARIGDYAAELQLSISVPDTATRVEIRAVDAAARIVSNVLSDQFAARGTSWRNAANPYDVDGDGTVAPYDALLLINRINLAGARKLEGEPEPSVFLDVDGDGYLAPSDVLQVVNYLNGGIRNASAAPAYEAGFARAEGEADVVDFLVPQPMMPCIDGLERLEIVTASPAAISIRHPWVRQPVGSVEPQPDFEPSGMSMRNATWPPPGVDAVMATEWSDLLAEDILTGTRRGDGDVLAAAWGIGDLA